MPNIDKNGFIWPKCTCNRRCDLESESEDFDEDSSFVDEESEEESSSEENLCFISAYKNAFLKNTILVTDKHEIERYILGYSKLNKKSAKNVNIIWDDIIVNVPILGLVKLKTFVEAFYKSTHKRKKQLKKPLSSMKLQNSNNLEKLDTNNTEKSASTAPVEQSKEDSKENNNSNSNKNQTDKKKQEVNANSIPQSGNKNNNIKVESKSDLNNKMGQEKSNSVNNTPTKIKLENKNEQKSSVPNDLKNQTPNTKRNSSVNGNSTLTDSMKTNMTKNQKTNVENNTPLKVHSENKNENNNKEKLDTPNQHSTPKKSNSIDKKENAKLINGISKVVNTPDKAVKVKTSKENAENKIKKSVIESKIANVAEKLEKKDLANTPKNTPKKTNAVDKNKQTNCSVNDNTKDEQTEPEFKKPLDLKHVINTAGKNSASKTNNDSSKSKTAPNNIHNNTNEETLDKATKKKLKKQRQKEKKGEGIRRDSCSSRDTTDNSSPDSLNKYVNKTNKTISEEIKKTGKKQNEKQLKNTIKKKIDTEESEAEKDEDQSKNVRTSEDDVDILTDDENLPAFLAKIKEKTKSKEKNKVKANNETKGNSYSTEQKDQTNDEQEFIIYSKKRNKISNPVINENSIFYSENFGENACCMISENNFMGALEYLVDAIDFNYTDQRHYLNRCYCYLSMKKNALALADAEYIIQISNNIGYLFIANVRAAQASYALQKYDEAETFMEEAVRINPTSVYALRELIVIQVAKIVSMGFSEKDSVLALEKYTSVKGALNYLIENKTNNLNNSKNEDLEISISHFDEFLYSSDDDEPSNTEVVNRMLNYEPGTVKFQHIVAKPPNAHLLMNDNAHCKSLKKEKKVVDPSVKINNSGQEKAIWIGNLTNHITDAMLKKKFKEFGKVVSVYHPLNESYAFVNFERAEDVINVLHTPCHELAGVKLLVKSAVRQK